MDTVTNSNGHGLTRSMRARPRGDERGHRSSRSPTSKREQQGIVAVCFLAAAVGAFASAEPTVVTGVNVVLNGLFAASVTWACSRARRWTWLVVTGVVVLAAQDVWLGLAVVALGIALVASLVSRRRIYGAVVGALAVQGMLRLPEVGFPLGSALVVAITLVPVFASAYLISPRRIRKRVHLAIAVIVGASVVGGALFAFALAVSYRPALRAVDQAEAGLTQVREGSNTKAANLLQESSKSFDESNAGLTSPWATMALAVPVISQHLHALDEVTAQGSAVTASASTTAAVVDYDQLRYKNGKVDVNQLRALAQPLAATAATFDAAVVKVQDAHSPWLLSPFTERIDEFDQQLDKAAPAADLAAKAASAAPGLLGADGVRHYFVAFITPAEERGLGGFMGNWAELTADQGSLTLTRSGRAEDLNQTPGRATREVTQPPDYVKRYARFQPGYFVQDVTFSPDMPSVGKVLGELYPEMGGDQIDGVLSVDPYGLAALLQLTGPIRIDGFADPITADNAADLLISKQYTQFASNAARKDFLDDAGRATFEKLVKADLPSPRKLGDVLSPAVAEHRIKFTSLTHDPAVNTDEQQLITALGADGTFPPKGDGDFFSLITQNKGNNKIDIFMHRKVQYSSTFDPETGSVSAHATVTIRNDAPPSGLPDAIIGSNDQKIPKGTNELFFSFYTPLGLRDAKVDTQTTPLEYQVELGYSVYSKFLTIPPGGTVTVDLDLFGTLTPGSTYSLGVFPQPSVNADEMVITTDVPPQWSITQEHRDGKSGFSIEPGNAKAVMADSPREYIQTQLDLGQR